MKKTVYFRQNYAPCRLASANIENRYNTNIFDKIIIKHTMRRIKNTSLLLSLFLGSSLTASAG
ncbi:hypothetical protein EZS27_039264, partial [termite gut metagenome]